MRGTYCLLIKVKKEGLMKVGSLGRIKFKRGIYIYVGSAMNGIEKRVARHVREKKRKFWHIDYLLGSKNTYIEKVFYREGSKGECKVARSFAKDAEPVEKFGCSDCNCVSHLFRLKKNLSVMSAAITRNYYGHFRELGADELHCLSGNGEISEEYESSL